MLARTLQTAIIVSLAFIPIPLATATPNCEALTIFKSIELVRAKAPEVAGNYCLTKDLLQIRTPSKGEFDFRFGRVTREAFLYLRHNGTNINLNNHSVTSDRPGKGGVRNSKPVELLPTVLKDVKIENGLIDVQVEGIGIFMPWQQPAASIWSDYAHEVRRIRVWNDLAPNSVPKSVREKIKLILESGDANYHFENLTILANDLGIKVAGARNIIRGNRIEVFDSKGAVYLYGPESIIEDNIIIFRGEAITTTAAPIKLHQGDRTIIRNNIIIVEASTAFPRYLANSTNSVASS